jgi:hypothetical protein
MTALRILLQLADDKSIEAIEAQDAERSFSAFDPYREMIELEFGRGRNAIGIWQDLVDVHGFPAAIRA